MYSTLSSSSLLLVKVNAFYQCSNLVRFDVGNNAHRVATTWWCGRCSLSSSTTGGWGTSRRGGRSTSTMTWKGASVGMWTRAVSVASPGVEANEPFGCGPLTLCKETKTWNPHERVVKN